VRIPFTADAALISVIERLGRTEDVSWSPSGRSLALVYLLSHRVLVLDVDVHFDADPPRVDVSGGLEISSPAIDHPHGVIWLDERTLAIASRLGEVGIFELPARRPTAGHITLDPVKTFGDDWRDHVKHPGSLSAFPVGLGLVELLVVNSYVHHVSRHLVDSRDAYAVRASESLISGATPFPDGVAHSPSGRWIAVSDHGEHAVFVFRNDGRLGEASRPDGALRGVVHPHGVTFSRDGKWILVADCSQPNVHTYRSEDGNWEGERAPVASVQILSDSTYVRGRQNDEDGGPKGIHLTADGLLAATCEEDPLIFFDMRPVLGQMAAPDPPDPIDEAERARVFVLRYLDAARSRMDDATAAVRRISEREVAFLVRSRWWRVTGPFRRLSARLQYGVHNFRRRLARPRDARI
jgi:hypothetical protein